MPRRNCSDEIEVKIRIPESSLGSFREKLLENGFIKTASRNMEMNTLFDYEDRRICASGSAVRLRSYDSRQILTWKGPLKPDPELKIREEIEIEVSSREAAMQILERIGLKPVLEYSKFREKFSTRIIENVEVCLDETRVGCFIEIEGGKKDITNVTGLLGLENPEPVKETYAELLGQPELKNRDMDK